MYGTITSKVSSTTTTPTPPPAPPSLPPANVTNFTAEAGDAQITLTWNDPDDVENGIWAGTKIVRKVGGYPASVNDGTLVVNSTVRNQYSTNGFTDTGLTSGTTYYYQAFPYSDKGKVNTNVINRVSATTTVPKSYQILGVAIDENNSNPETAVTYTDDAVGMTPASNDFLDFFKVKPCVFKDGVVQYYLNPNDYTKKEDGSASDLTGTDGSVMVEIPKIGYKFNRVGDVLNIQITDEPDKEGFCYLAHTRGSTVKDKLYVGAYLGYESGGKLISRTAVMPSNSKTIGAFRTLAQANGSGYDQLSFYQLTLLQCMYLIMYKNLDSQTALGQGYTSSDKNTELIKTGGTNTKGMCFGKQTGKLQMKFLGIEDFWGNLYQWIDGLYYDSTFNILTATENFNDTGNGYPYSVSSGLSANTYADMKKPQGTNSGGFCLKDSDGSSTTYYSDRLGLDGGSLFIFGGSWSADYYAGAFTLVGRFSASTTTVGVGARLMFL